MCIAPSVCHRLEVLKGGIIVDGRSMWGSFAYDGQIRSIKLASPKFAMSVVGSGDVCRLDKKISSRGADPASGQMIEWVGIK